MEQNQALEEAKPMAVSVVEAVVVVAAAEIVVEVEEPVNSIVTCTRALYC